MHEQALSVGTPIVTLPGTTLAGRFTLAMYDKLGIMDLVVTAQKVFAAYMILSSHSISINALMCCGDACMLVTCAVQRTLSKVNKW
jgi:hypothetical protein